MRLPIHTWAGLAILVGGQLLLRAGSAWMATWLTPVMWTGVILLMDGLVFRLRGRSWIMSRRRELPLLVLASVGVWLIFEAYNLHLRNWRYEGLPDSSLVRDLGYFWSFATIMPGVFEAADLCLAILERRRSPERNPESTWRVGRPWAWSIVGIGMVTIPLALPPGTAALLFGLVWIGFFLLLDPLNEMLGLPALRPGWRRGDRRLGYSLLLGGMICGLLWETWNSQAAAAGGAYWVYIFPDPLRPFGLRFGQMPVLGLLGFPPFALELFAFYQFIRGVLGGDRIYSPGHS
ncbi:MAG: hypothetical protein ACRDHG_11585 [Anaerolineales bacterium]